MKYIQNITFLIDPSIHVEWYNWMVESIFPNFKASLEISSYKLSRIISVKSPDGLSFALQLEFESLNHWQQFAATMEPAFMDHLRTKFMDSALTFATTMEIVEQG